MKSIELANLVVDILDEHKGFQIANLDVTTLTNLMDRIIICSSISQRHTDTLADKVIRRAKVNGIRPLSVEGKSEAKWILIDLHDVIVHIMLPEIRDFYSLEKLWSVTENRFSRSTNN